MLQTLSACWRATMHLPNRHIDTCVLIAWARTRFHMSQLNTDERKKNKFPIRVWNYRNVVRQFDECDFCLSISPAPLGWTLIHNSIESQVLKCEFRVGRLKLAFCLYFIRSLVRQRQRSFSRHQYKSFSRHQYNTMCVMFKYRLINARRNFRMKSIISLWVT